MNNSIIKFRQAIIVLVLIVLNGVGASASTSWTVNPSDYRYDMSLYLDVNFVDADMDYSQYEVGAFVGDRCCGIAEVLPLSNGTECLYLRARSNQESGETMTLKYRNKSTREILPVDNVSFAFESNGRLGYPSTPHVVTIIIHYDVTLSAGAGGSVDNGGGRIAEGTQLTVSAIPSEGYHFEQWSDGNKDNPRTFVVDGDLSITAEFGVNTYNLVYNVDGAPYKTFEVDFGTSLTPEAEPVKEGYSFSGWDNVPATMPASDVTVSGTFSINSYSAVFKIGEEVVETQTVVFGEPVVAPAAPEKEGHTFAGWQSVPETMPARDIEIQGSYTVNNYTLTYVVDGEPYKESVIAYDTALTPESNPEKEGYSFSGWDNVPATMPASDVTVSGTFSINSYSAVFKIGEEVVETQTVVFGEPVVAPAAPEKEGHTFAGWQSVPETMPARDIEIQGSYTVNNYTLTYVVDGEPYKETTVAYGTALTPESNPEKEGYTFSGWDNVPATMPASDVTVSGTFSINSYSAVFKIGEEVVETQTVVFGEPVVAPAAPEKEGHTFAGWQSVPETMPARDIEIQGSYTVNNYTLTYVVDGEPYKETTVAYGTALTPESNPEKEGYSFSGWDNVPATMPASDVTVSGTFSINSYCLTLYLNGVVYQSEMLEFGATIVVEEPIVPDGMRFNGWTGEIPEHMPAHDVDLYGTYSEISALDAINFDATELVTVCSISGHVLYRNEPWQDVKHKLQGGFYIINGKKYLIL